MDKPLLDEASRQALLDQEVQKYVRRGYRVIARTSTTAQLVKPKQFSLLIALLGLLCLLIGFVIYLLIYASMKDSTVYLSIDMNGKIQRR